MLKNLDEGSCDPDEFKVSSEEDHTFLSNFTGQDKPFRYEGMDLTLSETYIAEKRRYFSDFFEDLASQNVAITQAGKSSEKMVVEGKIKHVDIMSGVSKKSSLPFQIFTISLYNAEKDKFYFAKKKHFSIKSKEELDIVKMEEATFKEGTYVRFEGYMFYDPDDSFDPGPYLETKKYEPLDPPTELRVLPRIFPRLEFGLRTNYSPLDGITSSESWVKFIDEKKIKSFGVSDFMSVVSFPEIESSLKKINKGRETKIKPVYGVTLLVESKFDEKKFHVKVYAKNNTGLKRIYELVTKSFRFQGEHPSPFLRWYDLEDAKKSGDIITVAPIVRGEMVYSLIYRNEEKNKDVFKLFKEFFDFIEVSPINNLRHIMETKTLENGKLYEAGAKIEEVEKAVKIISIFSSKAKIPMIFSNHPRFESPHQNVLREAVMYQNKMMNYDPQDLHFWSEDEAKNSLSFLSRNAIEDVLKKNPQEFLSQIEDVTIMDDELHLPSLDGITDPDKMLWQKVRKNLIRLYGVEWEKNLPSRVVDRIKYEFNSIRGRYSVVYISSLLCIEKSEDLGYPVGSRGSVGSSAIAYYSGISEVNPIEPHYICPECLSVEFNEKFAESFSVGWDLPDKDCPSCQIPFVKDGWNINYSTFAGKDGNKVADIDLNFANKSLRGKIVEYVKTDLFPDRAFSAGTILQLKEHGQLKSMAKLFGNNRAKNNWFAQKTVNITKAMGKHPGGVLIIPDSVDVEDFTPLAFKKKGKEMIDGKGNMNTHLPFKFLHDALLKMDLLVSDSIQFLKILEKMTGVRQDDIIPYGPDVMEIFSSIDTLGINEFTTKTAFSMLEAIIKEGEELKWSHLISLSGLQHGTGVWSGNAREIISKGIASIDEIDGCRDEIVQTLEKLIGNGSIAYDIVESVRKGNGIPNEYEGLVKEKAPEWYFDYLNKIEYMFPKAHAAAYLLIQAKQAWYKKHYRGEFYATYLTIKAKYVDDKWSFMTLDEIKGEYPNLVNAARYSSENQFAKKKKVTACEIIIEAIESGYTIVTPHYNHSDALEWICVGKTLIPPLITVSDIAEAMSGKIVDERNKNGEFISLLDFYSRTDVRESSMLQFKNYDLGEWNPILKQEGDDIRKGRKKKNIKIKANEKKYLGEGQILFDFFAE